MQLEEIKKLADMARLDMSDEEMLEVGSSFDAILAYVGQIQEVSSLAPVVPIHMLANTLRDDVATHAPGQYRDVLIASMPDTQDGFLKVQQIL